MCESSNSSGEMASFEVLNPNGMPASLDSSEFSLIPDQPFAEEQALVNGGFNVDSVQTAFMSATQDLSVQEIQERVVELVKDNAAMKEALTWNNVMMKEQLSTISAWHNEMTTTMSKQQLSLKEANEKAEELEKENLKLQEEIKELKSLPQIIDSNETSTVNDESTEKVTLQLQEADSVIVELQKKIEEQNIELVSLKSNIEGKESSFNLQQKEYEILKSRDMLYCKQKRQLPRAFTYKRIPIQIRPLASSILCRKQIRCSSLEHEVEKRKSNIHELNAKVNELETNVKIEQNALEAENIRHAETKKLLNDVLPSYERMKKLIHVQSKDQKERDQDMENEREKENKRYLGQIDNLTAQLFDLEEKFLEREEKVKELTLQVDAMKTDCESVPILKEQLEVYKSDLQNLESSSYSCNNCNAGSSGGGLRFQNRKKSDSGLHKGRRMGHDARDFVEVQVYSCPLCNLNFDTVDAVEAHCNECLDKPANQ